MSAPLVSIIVPSFNQGRFLRATLDSILQQDYRPLELLVLDGASTDDTVAILREYAARHPELRWRSEPDGGPADAVNKGLAEARGAFAGIQSADDRYLPGAIREAAAILQADPGLGVVCADIAAIDADGQRCGKPRTEPPFSLAGLVSRGMIIHQSSAFFRLPLARALGGWNARYFCCDTELWLRMSAQARIVKVDRLWSERRQHDAQRDREAARMREAWQRMLDESALLERAPFPLRQAARAGRHVVHVDYGAGLSRWQRLGHAWLAALHYPPVALHMNHPLTLFPGSGRALGWLRGSR